MLCCILPLHQWALEGLVVHAVLEAPMEIEIKCFDYDVNADSKAIPNQ